MERTSQLNFIKQQGFKDAAPSACDLQYPALMFQPRLIGAIVAVGLVFQAPALFLILSAALLWGALAPSLNLFDTLYNSLVAGPKGLSRLTPAPGPRRFAQALAAAFALGIGLFLLYGWVVTTWVLEGVLAAAIAALVFGKFCLGSYVFHLLRGDAAFANRTLPWTPVNRD